MSSPPMPRLTEDLQPTKDMGEGRFDMVANAALEAFGRDGYKGASTEQIARKAGMSKGLLFFYFRNKRELYLKTMEWMYGKAVEIAVDQEFWEITDLFDLLIYAAEKKSALMRQYPWAMEFCIRAFYPDHRDIAGTMNSWNAAMIDQMPKHYFKNVDWSKFRDGIEPSYALNLLIWLADGWMHSRRSTGSPVDIDQMMEEFYRWCDMVRSWTYKPEYLVEASWPPTRASSSDTSGLHATSGPSDTATRPIEIPPVPTTKPTEIPPVPTTKPTEASPAQAKEEA